LSPTGHPNLHEAYDLGNGSLSNVDQRDVVDAGFLELTRLGELPSRSSDVLRSLPVTDSVIESKTASGPGWHRYGISPALFGQHPGSTDGYGDCYVPDPTSCSPTGAPWFGPATGSGHPWPLLDGERAEQDLQSGHPTAAAALALTMRRMAWGTGTVPEQVWEDPDVPASPYRSNPVTSSIGFRNGEAAGSADPLIWAQAQYVRLIRDLSTGRLLDQPSITHARYAIHGAPAGIPLTFRVTAPGAVTTPGHISTASPGITEDILASQEPHTTIAASRVAVRGTTSAGTIVDIALSQPGTPGNATLVVQAVAGAHGGFAVTLPVPRGHAIVTVSAVTGNRASGWAQQTVTRR
jgi:glucoamylase